MNGDIEKITSPFTMIDNEYYVSLNDLSQYMDYTYSWNMQENEAQAADNSDASIVPTSYDLRTKNGHQKCVIREVMEPAGHLRR